ncbi:hypothetical protein FAIPA1_110120 [Frankia sp. AiPs1]
MSSPKYQVKISGNTSRSSAAAGCTMARPGHCGDQADQEGPSCRTISETGLPTMDHDHPATPPPSRPLSISIRVHLTAWESFGLKVAPITPNTTRYSRNNLPVRRIASGFLWDIPDVPEERDIQVRRIAPDEGALPRRDPPRAGRTRRTYAACRGCAGSGQRSRPSPPTGAWSRWH